MRAVRLYLAALAAAAVVAVAAAAAACACAMAPPVRWALVALLAPRADWPYRPYWPHRSHGRYRRNGRCRPHPAATGATGPVGPTGATGATGPTGPTGPAGADATLSYAQFGTAAALRSNNEPLPMTVLIADGTGNIGNTANSVTLTPGRYLISYHLRADGTTTASMALRLPSMARLCRCMPARGRQASTRRTARARASLWMCRRPPPCSCLPSRRRRTRSVCPTPFLWCVWAAKDLSPKKTSAGSKLTLRFRALWLFTQWKPAWRFLPRASRPALRWRFPGCRSAGRYPASLPRWPCREWACFGRWSAR